MINESSYILFLVINLQNQICISHLQHITIQELPSHLQLTATRTGPGREGLRGTSCKHMSPETVGLTCSQQSTDATLCWLMWEEQKERAAIQEAWRAGRGEGVWTKAGPCEGFHRWSEDRSGQWWGEPPVSETSEVTLHPMLGLGLCSY